MPTPIRASEATLIEVRQALQRIEMFRRLVTYEAEANPGKSDDRTQGFVAGALWTNTLTNTSWRLTDATEGAAVWNRLIGVEATDGGVAGTPLGFILVTNSAGDYVPLGVGANGEVLFADSSKTLGLKWDSTGTLGYTPAVPDDWEDTDPTTVVGALDRTAGGHAGVALVSATEPTNPAVGQAWLDTSATGSADTRVWAITTITTDTTLTSSETVVKCDATSGTITVTLPAAASSSGTGYYIKKIDSTRNTVTIDANADELIDDGVTAVIKLQQESVLVVCDGTSWSVH